MIIFNFLFFYLQHTLTDSADHPESEKSPLKGEILQFLLKNFWFSMWDIITNYLITESEVVTWKSRTEALQ